MRRKDIKPEQNRFTIPVVGFSGWSGSGKTTLIEKLIPSLQGKGLRVAVVKHDVHGISAEETGKDSFRFRQAGAEVCVLCGPDGPSLPVAIESITRTNSADLILVEGFKSAPIPHIGLARIANNKGFSAPFDQFHAIVTDHIIAECPVPVFGMNDIESITSYIMNNLELFSSY